MASSVSNRPGASFPTSTLGTASVKSGDTLSKIASQNGVSVDALLKANPEIKDPNRIQVGQQIRVPMPATAATPPKDTFERAQPARGFLDQLKDVVGSAAATIAKAVGGEAKLSLGPNERFRSGIALASERTGIDPAAIAALINAEAAKVSGAALTEATDQAFHGRHPELNKRPLGKKDGALIAEWKQLNEEMRGQWDPKSKATSSTATGLTQFLDASWLGEARRPGTYLNQVARERKYVGETNTVVDQKALLALRTDPTFAIVAAAEYGKRNLDTLEAKGLIAGGISDDQKAKYIYLAHHEGPVGAEAFLKGTLTNAKALGLLKANVTEKVRKALVEKHGGESAAYKAWLNAYIDSHIVPARFR